MTLSKSYVFYEFPNSYEFVRMSYPSLGSKQIVQNHTIEVGRISHLIKYVRIGRELALVTYISQFEITMKNTFSILVKFKMC